MNLLPRLLAALFAGVLALLAVGVGVTAALDSYVWPSLMLGVPAGVVSGLAVTLLTYVWLTARDERARTGTVSPGTRTLGRAVVGGLAGFVVVGTLAAAAVFLTAFGLAASMLFVGLPVGLLAGAVGAVLAVLYGRRQERSAGPGGVAP